MKIANKGIEALYVVNETGQVIAMIDDKDIVEYRGFRVYMYEKEPTAPIVDMNGKPYLRDALS